jgi:hypothetical protein
MGGIYLKPKNLGQIVFFGRYNRSWNPSSARPHLLGIARLNTIPSPSKALSSLSTGDLCTNLGPIACQAPWKGLDPDRLCTRTHTILL